MKKFSDYDPMFREHGINYPAAAGIPGVGVQSLSFTMVTGGAVVFAAQGLANMANATYQVIVHNQTDIAATGLVTVGSKTTNGFVITGSTNGDVLDIVIVGQIAGQKVDA